MGIATRYTHYAITRFDLFAKTRSDRPLGPPSFLQWVPGLFPGIKQRERGVNHPPPYLAPRLDSAKLYIYHHPPPPPRTFMGCYSENFTFAIATTATTTTQLITVSPILQRRMVEWWFPFITNWKGCAWKLSSPNFR
jgi:hypothetical protein